ncbi:NAD(P)-dependent oxidoreductase [Histidinibacterium aquaticum]|uniref:NAD(P)-dependent oxidoreductase n=1 Tax=Histidinibacterium aquaticum TaxID=2613962 RepID=A0A5J5GJT9_9RHOB|nr:NAD(P)-dependent oxidoreductase [Histidinibacterium aquaticum]
MGNLAFVGFGEAATAFLDGWGDLRPRQVTAVDIKAGDPATAPEMTARFDRCEVDGHAEPGSALGGVEVVFSVVTADQALAAAEAAAPVLSPGTLWLDCNSCAPETKRAAADVIEGAGGRYVDVAVMSPVHPKRHHVPLLLAGPRAAEAEAVLARLDMRPRIAGENVGEASAIKMIRSVMIKGMEALSAECFLAARRAGVDAAVLASLEASDPELTWPSRGAYNLERMMVHGVRRAAEMREVEKTVAALGLGGGMSAATADWQARIGTLGAEAGEDDLLDRVDRILAKL